MTKDDRNPQLLKELGFDRFFEEHFAACAVPGSVPARVSSESKDSYLVITQHGEVDARAAGKLRYQGGAGGQPAVGDWVALTLDVGEIGIIRAILPRKSRFSRNAAGRRTEEQILAANVDSVFIVSGLDGGRNFNLRRIERYLTLAWGSGAVPVIVLNKADLCSDIGPVLREVEAIAVGVPVHAVSAKVRMGLEALRGYLGWGRTAAFLGSSGVGKSALINALLGEEVQETGELMEDLRGRHTTSRRDLFLLPGGGCLIDTPGMREIQMWAGEEDLEDTFTDIAGLATGCRFRDCRHGGEPGCAVREAIHRGELDSARWESYEKLRSELEFLAARDDQGLKAQEKARWKKVSKWSKEISKRKRE